MNSNAFVIMQSMWYQSKKICGGFLSHYLSQVTWVGAIKKKAVQLLTK